MQKRLLFENLSFVFEFLRKWHILQQTTISKELTSKALRVKIIMRTNKI